MYDSKISEFGVNSKVISIDLADSAESHHPLTVLKNNNTELLKVQHSTFISDVANEKIGTFITDKVKGSRIDELKDYYSIETPKFLQPYYLNQLCIDLEEQQNNQPKGIHPLFFVINGEKKINKEKYRNIPLNYKKGSTLKINPNDNYMKYILKHDLFLQQTNDSHTSVKTTTFVDCFNKSINDKSKIKADWKKVLFNNTKNHYETKVNMIKDIIKVEMRNRSSGKGIFNNNIKYQNRDRDMSHWKEKFENKVNEPLVIDLQKKNDFQKKSMRKTAEMLFNRNYFILTFPPFQNQKGKRDIKQNNTITKENFEIQKKNNN